MLAVIWPTNRPPSATLCGTPTRSIRAHWQLRLTALSQWHLHQGFVDPTATPTVRKTLAGIARCNGRPKKKARALPIEDMELVVAALARQGTLKAAPDNALLQVGFFGGFRRSELASIAVNHLAWARRGSRVGADARLTLGAEIR